MDKSMIHAASGSAFMDKTFAAIRKLISNMAANYKQFGTKEVAISKGVNEMIHMGENQRLEDVAQQHQQVNVAQQCQPTRLYGICNA